MLTAARPSTSSYAPPTNYIDSPDAFMPGICGPLLGARFTYATAVRDPMCLLQM